MPRPLTGAWTALCLLGLVVGCAPTAVTTQVDQMRENNQALLRQFADLKLQVQLLEARVENEERERWSDRLCKSGRIAEFVGELQTGIPEVCTAGSLEDALLFMNTMAYATANFHPNDGVEVLHVARKGQLHKLLDAKNLHPSTRFIVMVQPSAETQPSKDHAKQLGDDIIDRMRTQIAPGQKLKILGPYFLPCRLRGEVSRRYHGPMDAPMPGEPLEGKPRVRVWVFRTDC